jgi:hypothetical protein
MAVIRLTQDMRGYLSQEQIEAMRRRMTELGVVAEHAVGVEMPSLYQHALAEMRAGTPASDQAVRRIVDRLDELSRLLRGPDRPASTGPDRPASTGPDRPASTGAAGAAPGEPAGSAVRRMWLDWGRQHPESGGADWPALAAYLDAARAARHAVDTERNAR